MARGCSVGNTNRLSWNFADLALHSRESADIPPAQCSIVEAGLALTRTPVADEPLAIRSGVSLRRSLWGPVDGPRNGYQGRADSGAATATGDW